MWKINHPQLPSAQKEEYSEGITQGKVCNITDSSRTKVEELLENNWGNCNTDPGSHNSDKFQYLVHAIKDQNDMSSAITASMMLQGAQEEGSFRPSGDILGKDSLSENLRRKAEWRAISCSLINQNHPGMWSQQGIIVALKSDKIIIGISGSDAGSASYSLGKMRTQFANQRKYKPDELLQITSGTYNEVVVSGENPEDLDVLGVVVEVDAFGNPSNYYAKRLMDKARADNLPIVELKPKIQGGAENTVSIQTGENMWNTIPFDRLNKNDIHKITSFTYFDPKDNVKYRLSFSVDNNTIEIWIAGTIDRILRFDLQSGKVSFWDHQKFNKAKVILPKIKEAFSEIIGKNKQLEKLLSVLEENINLNKLNDLTGMTRGPN